MSWSFRPRAVTAGRALRIRHGGQVVAEFVFGLPGETLPGWESDDTEARLTVEDPFVCRLRHLPEEFGWVTLVSVDNGSTAERPLPPLGMAVTVAPGWSGWSWTADVDGFVVLCPDTAATEWLLVRLRDGFIRAAAQRPVFTPRDRRGQALPPGAAAFHLADPDGSLRPHGRFQTRLELSAVTGWREVAACLPGWLPELVVVPHDDVRLDTPDMAIVPGPGVQMTGEDTVAVLSATPGHRTVAVHGVRGVHRLRLTYPPVLDAMLPELVAAWMTRRPSGLPSATGAVIAGALARRAVVDAEAALDWLEREDWLARGEVWGPAIAAVVGTETHDEVLLQAACAAVGECGETPGAGIIATRCWLACLQLGVPVPDLSAIIEAEAQDPIVALERALLRGEDAKAWADPVLALTHRLGSGLPGQPIGLPEADAGLAVALLRLVPEQAATHEPATRAAEHAAALLLADHADGLHPSHDGLAWLLLGDLGG